MKTTPHTVKKVWHGGCKQVRNGKAHQKAKPNKNKKRNKKMNGLIKQTNLDGLNFLGSLAVALSSVALVIYVMANGLGGIA
jgi:hypothetical protein